VEVADVSAARAVLRCGRLARPPIGTRLTSWLSVAPSWAFTAFAIAASFSTYFSMYAFRKPFTAAKFDGEILFGGTVELKTALVIAQIVGYTVSKYLGVRVLSEADRSRRGLFLIGLIVAAEISLLIFAFVPSSLRIVALFVNGLALGMVWGLVVSYLEGRTSSELLLAGLSCSFIVASGVVKDIGRYLLREHAVSEAMMPFLTGLLFILPFIFSVWCLERLPRPSEADVRARTERAPMDAQGRRAFVSRFLPGLALLFIAYFFLTAFRDFRDNYGVEIFKSLGYESAPAIFTLTEVPVAFGVMVTLALLNMIKNNRRGLLGAYAVMISGFVLMGGGTLLFDRGLLRGDVWMVLVGLGSYLAYVPFGSMLFDRMIASTRFVGTAVFAIYLADAIGYSGSIGVQLFKDIVASGDSRFTFFLGYTYVVALLGIVTLALSGAYFASRIPRDNN
jgi:hypothetical protein